jgi:hypothetical protein
MKIQRCCSSIALQSSRCLRAHLDEVVLLSADAGRPPLLLRLLLRLLLARLLLLLALLRLRLLHVCVTTLWRHVLLLLSIRIVHLRVATCCCAVLPLLLWHVVLLQHLSQLCACLLLCHHVCQVILVHLQVAHVNLEDGRLQ